MMRLRVSRLLLVGLMWAMLALPVVAQKPVGVSFGEQNGGSLLDCNGNSNGGCGGG